MTKLDRIPIAQLPDKYGIVKSVLYDRINRLGIQPTKIGNKSYISGEQLDLLDQLHAHMSAGGSMAEFADALSPRNGASLTRTSTLLRRQINITKAGSISYVLDPVTVLPVSPAVSLGWLSLVKSLPVSPPVS